jgi:zinc transport system substrate-binding protein
MKVYDRLMFEFLFRVSTALLLLAAGSGCSPVDSPDQSLKNINQHARTATEPLVIAVAYPLQYLSQRIVGETMTIACPVPAGQSASHWRPGRDDILQMQRADLIIANGLGAKLATWMDTASIPDAKICNSARHGLSLRDFITVEDAARVHSHGPGGEHSHSTTVPYTWLDPAMADAQAVYIAQELSRVFPDQASTFGENLKRLQDDLVLLSQQLSSFSASSGDQPWTIYTANPDLKFFTRAAGVQDRHLQWFEAPSLETAETVLIKRLANDDQTNVLTVDEKTVLLSTYAITPELETVLSELGVDWVQIDTLDSHPHSADDASEDYLSVMNKNIERLNSITKPDSIINTSR